MAATTKYRRDANLRKYIHQQLMALGTQDPLPSVREIMRDCDVSQAKVECVLDELQTQGLIERIPRRGIFKRAAVDTPQFIPVVDIIYCGVTCDIRSHQTGFHPELIDAIARQMSDRYQGIRVHQFPVGTCYPDFVHLFSKADLRACIMVGLENLDLVKAADEHQVAWVSLFPQTVTPTRQSILIDAESVVRRQLEHLWGLGHKRIGYLHIVDERIYHRDHVFRREAYYKLMAERGLQVQPNWVVYGDYYEEPFRRNFARLFETEPYPTAVILADPNLPWAYRWLREKGLEVGKDISLVGTDDLAMTSCLDPPATTLRVCRKKAAEMALKVLDRVIQGEDQGQVEYLPVELVVRRSTGMISDL